MNRHRHLARTGIAVGVFLAASACTSAPSARSAPTGHYSFTSSKATEPTQPLPTRAATPTYAEPESESIAGRWRDSLGAESSAGHELVLRANELRGQGGGAAAQGAPNADSAAEVGRKLSNPASDAWALFSEFDYTKNNGTLTGGRDSKTVGVSMIFQPITPIPLTENWKLITRPTLPIFLSTPVPGVDGGGIDFDRESGLGDMVLPLVPAHNHGIELGKGTLVGGVGPTFQFPTATDNDLGTDTWETGVASIAVYKTPKWTWVAFPQYWWSVGKSDNDADHTSHGELLYAVLYEAGNAWQIGLAPTISFDNEASSGNKWNVPIGLQVAKTTKIGKRMFKFEVAFEYSVENQDDYGKEFMLRLNVIPVVMNPFSRPLF